MKPISDKLRDFTGQNIYIGMDVHHKSWKVHIYSDEFELKSFSQDADVEQLYNYLHKNYKNASINYCRLILRVLDTAIICRKGIEL
ncbi:MAG: hypothetical protein KF746_00595 [Chitinophagaceae bacterium]|nr:hypothetical protein [Chitinophagaceae bacterium]